MSTKSAGPLRPFHLAFPVRDLEEARTFYGRLLGCEEGRSAPHWIDFNLFGHQIVAHLDEHLDNRTTNNPVDGEQVPVPHFGVVMTMAGWQTLADRLTAANTHFVIQPTVRFKGQVGEQATMFFCDPSGNALEFKAFGDDDQLFTKD